MKIASVILSLCCYGGAIYMVVILFCQYQSNLDSSQSSMKRFNESPPGRYPSFTFCIYAQEGKLFKNDVLQTEYGLSQTDYYDLLSGGKNDTNLILSQIAYNEVVTGIDEFLEQFEVEDDTYQAYREWTPSMKDTSALPLHQSYHDPTTNCFTYDTEYNKTVSLNALKVKFNITKFQQLFDKSGKMYIQAHYPGLMIRDMKTYLMKISNWHLLNPSNGNNEIDIQFPGVTLMRFRENAIDPCDPKLTDDDSEWMEFVNKQTRCIPPYWNNTDDDHHDHDDFEVCSSQKMLGNVKDFWPMDGGIKANEVFKNYTKPCNKMIVFNNMNHRAYDSLEDVLKIKLRMREEFYQEILNTRAFGMADLWANIGGYVGIFCGYSILQATNYFMDNVKSFMMHNKK